MINTDIYINKGAQIDVTQLDNNEYYTQNSSIDYDINGFRMKSKNNDNSIFKLYTKILDLNTYNKVRVKIKTDITEHINNNTVSLQAYYGSNYDTITENIINQSIYLDLRNETPDYIEIIITSYNIDYEYSYIYDIDFEKDNIWEKLDIIDETIIKNTSSLKGKYDLEENEKNVTKKFKIISTKKNQEILDYNNIKNIYNDKHYNIKYNCMIYYNSINSLSGYIIIDDIEYENDYELINLIFIKNKKSFYKYYDTPLYLIDTVTLGNQTALDIKTQNDKFLAGETGLTHNYIIIDDGSDPYNKFTLNKSITKDFLINNLSGITADMFTATLNIKYILDKFFDFCGYTWDNISGINLDIIYLLLSNRLNWDDHYFNEKLDNQKLSFGTWYIDNRVFNTPTIYDRDYFGPDIIFDPLYSTIKPENSEFINVGGGYSRYNNKYKLYTIRYTLDWSNLYFTIDYFYDSDYAKQHPFYKINLMVAQQYGDHTSNDFEHIILDTVIIEPSTLNSTDKIYFNISNTNKETYHSYKSDTQNLTYFYLTYEYFNDTGNQDPGQNHHMNINLFADDGISLLTDYYTNGERKRISLTNFIGKQIGLFNIRKDLSAGDLMNNLLKKYNLILEIDEISKHVTIKNNNFNFNKKIDLSNKLIQNKPFIKKSQTTLPSEYNFIIDYDEDNYNLISNPIYGNTEYTKKFNVKNNIKKDVNISSMYYSSISNPYVLNTYVSMLDTRKINKSETNLTPSKFITYDDIFYFEPYSNVNISNDKYSIVDIQCNNQYYIKYLTLENTTAQNIYDINYSDYINKITNKNNVEYQGYFIIDEIIYNEISFREVIIIDNIKFIISKIYDWTPNVPTKIDLIKINE